MPTRNLVLTQHQQEMIEDLVRSGRYQNASEVLRDGLRLIEQREARETAKLEALRTAVRVGWRDLEEGRFKDVDEGGLDEYVRELGARATKLARTDGQ